MRAAIHTAEGQILRVVQCPDGEAAQQCAADEQFLELPPDSVATDATHYVVSGELQPFPPQPDAACVWNFAEGAWCDPRTPAQVVDAAMAAGEVAAQAYLDAAAQAWGYDDLRSAASYATSKVPRFAAEAAALVGWRDDVWLAAYELGVQVRAGAVPIPASTEAFVALLPPVPARPTP